jgi:mono/diheme cytochrome c family protein
MEKKLVRIYRILTIFFSSLLIILIVSIWMRENFRKDYRKYQAEFEDLIAEKVNNEIRGENSGIGKKSGNKIQGRNFELAESGIRQLVVEDLKRTDRCIICHLGIENLMMKDVPLPHRLHSGSYIEDHPIHRYGCTICHGGQGRAVDKKEAFGRDPDVYWPDPLLDQPYIQASCAKCHLAIFSETVLMEGTEVLIQGQQIFIREGCLGCHKARGTGGVTGPDLTTQGEKKKHEYNFQNIVGEQTISNWLREHFKDPEMVSTSSQMLRMNLPEEELDALVTFTMGLAKPDIPLDYFAVETLNELKGRRKILEDNLTYTVCCSACHGKNKEGKNYNQYETGVPAIQNKEFLSVASSEFIRFTLLNGRSQRQMSSWLPDHSGLFDSEIDSLVKYIRNGRKNNSTPDNTRKLTGNKIKGKELYDTRCRMCHGDDGKGLTALALINPDFQKYASDRFIYNTIRNGRYNTAMPCWSYLTDKEMSDLMTLIRSWGTGYGSIVSVKLQEGSPEQGALHFHYLCSRCHGEYGEGATGPSILNPDFLHTADDTYLYMMISKGRMNTAMIGWIGQITDRGIIEMKQISDIIAFMKSSVENPPAYIYPGANPGNPADGKKWFTMHCVECHGENGNGMLAPQLNNQEFLNAATNGYILATISLGRTGTAMPTWGNGNDQYPVLTGKERQDLTAYIRSLQKIMIKFH